MDTRAKLRALLKKNPQISAGEASAKLGISRQRLYVLLKEEGLSVTRKPIQLVPLPERVAYSDHPALPPYIVGEMNELKVAVDLLLRGYDVYRSVTGRGLCDLVAVHRIQGNVVRIEVKTAYKVKGRTVAPKGVNNKFDTIARVFGDGSIEYDPSDP